MTTDTAAIIDHETFAPFASESYRKNAPKAEDKGWQPCPCCGKAVKNSNGEDTLYVEVLYIKAEGVECGYRAADGKGKLSGPISDTQGWWAVGASCARKLRKAGADVRNLDVLD